MAAAGEGLTVLPEITIKPPSGVKVAVFGSGSFGTALSYVLATQGHKVVIHTRTPEVAESINNDHVNSRYLTGYTLPEYITASTDIVEVLKGCHYILHSVPAQASLSFLRTYRTEINREAPGIPIISVSKGLAVETRMVMKEVFLLGLETTEAERPLAFMSGPSFAKELMQRFPTGVVVASHNQDVANQVQKLFSSTTLRVYTSDDVIGVELLGALKNVYAIAAGIVSGCGLGYNSVTGIVTRGLNEMRQFCLAMGGQEKTIAGLAGVGDLMLTCFGALSRNRSVGLRLGQGEKLEDIIASMNEVAEGVPTTAVALQIAQEKGLDLPILGFVNSVILGEITPKEALVLMMNRPLRSEF
jgi:glycerol-3-phosphate dehydrogenase